MKINVCDALLPPNPQGNDKYTLIEYSPPDILILFLWISINISNLSLVISLLECSWVVVATTNHLKELSTSQTWILLHSKTAKQEDNNNNNNITNKLNQQLDILNPQRISLQSYNSALLNLQLYVEEPANKLVCYLLSDSFCFYKLDFYLYIYRFG